MKKTVLLILWVIFSFGFSAKASVTINQVNTTISTCANNGTITISATTTTGTLLYAITAGPVIKPVQTNHTFSSLPPGTYTIEVSNTANESQTTSVTVTGNYQLPDFMPVLTPPHCPDSSSGNIVGNVTPGTGAFPYLWELVAPSPITTPPQPSDTFNSLLPGTYTIKLTDGCNNVQTKTVILYTPPITMTFGSGYASITGCDTVEIALAIATPFYRAPYKITYTIGGTSYTIDTAKVDDESAFNGGLWVYFTVPGMSYGGVIDNIVITNSCGVQCFVPQQRICSFQVNNPAFVPISIANCQLGLLTYYGVGDIGCTLNVFPKFPLEVIIRDIPANNVVETKTYRNRSDYTLASTAMLPGASYNFTMTDSCNRSYTTTISTPVLDRYVSLGMGSQVMLDSTVNASLSAVGFPTQGTTLTIKGGPVSVQSTKPGYAYSEDYIYPKTFTGQLSSDSSTFFMMANTGPGVYTYVITDSCGNQYPGTFEITRDNVSSFNYRYTYQKGCAGSSALQYEVTHNTFTEATLTDIASGTIIHTAAGWQMNQNPFSNVVNNITAEDYLLKFKYYGPYGSYGPALAMNNILIDSFVVRDTIHVEPYQNPALKTTAVSLCSGQLFLALVPDSTKGIPPYQYEIISGPQTFPPQASSLFELAQTGNYTIRLTDSCGNSVSTDVTVDPLVFPPMTGSGNVCGNDSAALTYGASTYFTYTWTKPDGSTYTGDTLFINPVTPADTGTYTVQRVTTINGCTNSETSTYRLSIGKKDSITAGICPGQTYQFGSRILTQPGIYRDTILTSNCDSISVLNLLLNNFKKDSSNASICSGQSFSFGSRMLTLPGIYTDTLATAGCDSISIVNLTVNEWKKDSSIVSICRGQVFPFGNRVLTQTGIYRDTISTSTCDSVSIVNLTVNEWKKDSSVVSICRGQVFPFGNRVLTQAGIYRDTIPTSTCDSVSIVNLTVNEWKKDSSVVSICRGQVFPFGNRVLTQTGIYRDTISTSTCDSVSIVNLTVNEWKKDSSIVSICRGQVFPFGNRVLTQAGIYRDTISTSTCDSVSIVNLTVNEWKKDSSVVSICRGQVFPFGNRVLTQAGIYRDTIPTSTCDSVSIVNLTVNELKRDSSAASICNGQSFTFGSRLLTQSGLYRDTLSTTGCDSISVVNLSVNDHKTDSVSVSICKGDRYTFGNNILSQAGIYRDTIPTSGCDSISIIHLIVNDTPAVQVRADKYFVVAGDIIQLTATPGNLAAYLWTSFNSISRDDIPAPTSIVSTPSWYKLTVTDSNNCSNTDSVFVAFRIDSVFSCNAQTIIHIPTAFTPDGNGSNDRFRILGIQNVAYKLYQLTIYNRWGEVIFETTDSAKAWDGTYKGKPANMGNYVYFFRSICADGKTFTRKGNVLLLR